MAEVRLETTGEDRGAGDLLEKLERQVEDLRREVERLSGKPLDIPTDPADAALKELRAELRRLEGAFDRAERALSFARTRNEIEGTTASARRLAAAESVLAARGKELISFSRRLPPELRRTSGEMDRLERETEQAASAFRRFQATTATSGRGLGGLISSIGQLRAGLGVLVAALGVQQLLRFGRALIGMGQSAVETKLQFDRLIPGLRAFTGSTELANEVAGKLAATAERLKTPLGGLVNPFLAISAGGREAGLSISEINELFEASLLSARAFGKGADEVQRLLTGISQVAGKGVACVDTGVEILTDKGWKRYDEIVPGKTRAKTLAIDTGAICWETIERVFVYDLHDKPAATFSVGRADVVVSAGHRVVVWKNGSPSIDSAANIAGRKNPFLTIEYEEDDRGEVKVRSSAAFVSPLYNFRGRVWCPKTPSGTWVARKSGSAFFTGNSMEEFRQQIGEAIPNAIPALAKGLSEAEGRIITTAEAIARISSGTLPAAEALRALTAGFEALNAAAAEEQLKTLAGDIGAFQNAAEGARRVLGDALEPALRKLLQTTTELIKENPRLIDQLGTIGGLAVNALEAATEKAAGLLEKLGKGLDDNARRLLARADEIQQAAEGQSEALQRIANERAEQLRIEADRYGFVAAAASKAFDQITLAAERSGQKAKVTNEEVAAAALKLAEDQKKAQDDVAENAKKTAEEILNEWNKSFEAQAKAAGISAEEIAQAQKDLAAEVGKIQDEQAKRRADLEKEFQDLIKRNGDATLEEQKRFAAEAYNIQRDAVAAREALEQQALESLKIAHAERLRLEAEAAAKALAEAQKITEGARESARQRIETDEELHTRRQELEAEAASKILEAQQAFVEKLKKPKADREKLAQELADKVIEIELDLAGKIAAEQEKVAKAAEEASKRRIAAEQAVQAEYQDSIADLRELVDTLNEAAQGPEGEGGGLQQVADQAGEIREELEGASLALGEFIVSLEDVNAGNLGNPLDALQGPDPRSGQAAADFFGSFGAGAEEATGRVEGFADSLGSALDAAEGLSGGARDAVLDLVARYQELAEQGAATLEDQRSFADELVRIFDGFGVALDDPVAAIQERLEELRQSQSDATLKLEEETAKAEEAYQAVADAAGETADATEGAGEAASLAWDPVTRSLESVEEAASDAGESAEELGVKWERIDGVLTATQEKLEGTKESGEAAAEGLRAAGDAAGEVTSALQGAGEAIDPLKGEIVGEGEPEKLRDLGAAAGEALPSIEPLAVPVQTLAESSAALAAALPVISAALPQIATLTGELLEKLGASEIDFEAIATNIEDLAGPLTEISAALPLITAAVTALPEPIKALQEAAAPLFETVRAAAEDDRFGRIGQGLASIAAILPPIPEPMERLQTVLEKIVDQREDIEAALKGTAGGLAAVAAEEILAGLAELVDSLDEALGLISELDETTKSWQSTLGQIVEDIPELVFKLGELADRAREDVAPGLATAAEASELLREELAALEQTSASTFASAGEDIDATTEKMKALRVEIQGATEDLHEMAAAATEAAAATASIQIGS